MSAPDLAAQIPAGRSEYVEINALRTHVLTAGDGPPLVLLHSGEFGASAALSWERIMPALARSYRVIAPDWLGFGDSAKVHDFEGSGRRRLTHMAALLDHLGVDGAPFVGSSMGGTVLARDIASSDPVLPVTAAVLCSGGGFVPLNEARTALLEFDGSESAMRAMMRVLFTDPTWALRDEYIARRLAQSNRRGAWEAVAAARFKSPQVPPRSEFGQPDTTNYEAIRVPTLVVAGADDQLREPGYAAEIATRIPNARVVVYDHCGHVPNLEQPELLVRDIENFLAETGAAGSPAGATTTTTPSSRT